jgi:CDP-glucose 4,6-dehydratase
MDRVTAGAPFGGVYAGKRVLVTGHTGFKGSWLTAWLLRLGAHVIGVSKDVPTTPSMFNEIDLAPRIDDRRVDVRDIVAVRHAVADARPDFAFHLAAQAIVSRSYADPADTITTNVVGTMAVLDALRTVEQPCATVMVTSDKCYDNVEWSWGYRENDRLGGKDVYSGSKGAAELVIRSYVHSFFQHGHPVRCAVGRAGNVIGGGDWAPDRIVVDCVRAWTEGRPVEVRSPSATRPWQHVLEPLSGYLALGQALVARADLHGEAFNFGPRAQQNRSVVELMTDLAERWSFPEGGTPYRISGAVPFHEASLLKLNCDKALLELQWEPTLDYAETIGFVGDWYAQHYRRSAAMQDVTAGQIEAYERLAAERRRVWSTP